MCTYYMYMYMYHDNMHNIIYMYISHLLALKVSVYWHPDFRATPHAPTVILTNNLAYTEATQYQHMHYPRVESTHMNYSIMHIKRTWYTHP